MITGQKISISDVTYSKLSGVLRLGMEANPAAIKTVEDICFRNDMTIEEIAQYLGELLERSLQADYTRGGQRRKFD